MFDEVFGTENIVGMGLGQVLTALGSFATLVWAVLLIADVIAFATWHLAMPALTGIGISIMALGFLRGATKRFSEF